MRNTRILLLLLLVLFSVESFAQDKNRRRQEIADEAEIAKNEQVLKLALEELERVKVKRWQDKRNSIARKEAFAEAWEDIRREMEQLAQKKAQKEATLLRLDNQVQQMESEVKALEDRQKDFGIQLSEKAVELQKQIKDGFPHRIEPEIVHLRKIQSDLESRGFRPSADLIQALFARQKERFQLGETREIIREQFALENITPANPAPNQKRAAQVSGVVAGYFFRLGMVYKAFVSTEGPDAAILGKTGNLGDEPWKWLERINDNTKNDLHQAKSVLLSGDTTAYLMLPVDVILRKATGGGYSAEDEKSLLDELIREWIGAGFVIWFLLGILILALGIITEKIWFAIFKSFGSKRLFNKITKLVEEGKVDEARQLASKSKAPISDVLHSILSKANTTREEAENESYARMLHHQPILERNISTLNILAAAAPLFGLLGTVSGMISMFSAITMHGTNDPKIMAAGIAEALLSTKWALITALPLMLVFISLRNMMGKVISDMEKYAASLLNQLFSSKPNA